MTDEFLGLRKVAEQAVTRGVKMPMDAMRVFALLDRVETAERENAQLRKREKVIHEAVVNHKAAIARVRELHQWNRVDQYDDRLGDWVEEYCTGCHEVWPCATIRALEGDE